MAQGSDANHAAGLRQAAALIDTIPVVSKAELQRRTQVCDILLTLPPDDDYRNFFYRCWIKISSLAQDCQYCSAKLYLGQGLVAGYGFRSNGDKAVMRTMKFDQFLNRVKGAILIRVPGLTAAQQDNIINFIHTKIGTGFDCRRVVVSFLKRKLGPYLGQADTAPGAKASSTPGRNASLTCSTMISLPFFGEGIEFSTDPLLAWPIDFLLSPRTLKICRF